MEKFIAQRPGSRGEGMQRNQRRGSVGTGSQDAGQPVVDLWGAYGCICYVENEREAAAGCEISTNSIHHPVPVFGKL